MFGLRNDDILLITSIFEKYPTIKEAYIFGSRAKGNFKNGSDVDIALKGAEITQETIIQISMELNENTIMPYHFDVLNYNTIQNVELVEHVDRVGLVLFSKKR